VRLPDFSFPSDTLPEILAKAAQYNEWVKKIHEENFVKVGVVGAGEPRVLPGILESIEVSDSLLIDNVESEGKSGSVKIISGWSDADITLSITLIDIPQVTNGTVTPQVTRFDCLREIAGTFKQMKDGKPQVYVIQHPHIAAWGVRAFIFNRLKSQESKGKRIITCSLEFDEYDSTIGKSQDRQLGITSAEQQATAQAPQNPPVSDQDRAGLGKLEGQYAGR
jgi:hypothetical protein